jgi:acetyl-CoA carboxylase carboxyl transferase subunit beta
MNWINNVVRPKIQRVFKKRDTPDNLWVKCSNCGEMVFHRDLITAYNVCPSCDFHMKLGTKERFGQLFDNGEYEEIAIPEVPADPLKFRDQKRYPERLKDARAKTGRNDAVTVAHGALDGIETVISVQDFAFMGGSLGMAAGEAIVVGAREALERKAPYIVVAAAGGARMQEGILSLMQMPRTTVAVQMLREARLPYIVVLTDPTTGGVTASYAMLGDVQIAEPGALICFAGPRVIEQTIREKLPEGFQRAEYLLDHGMLDRVTPRTQMRDELITITRMLMGLPPAIKGDLPAPGPEAQPQQDATKK